MEKYVICENNFAKCVTDSFQLNVGTMFKRDYIYLLKLSSPVDEVYSGPYSLGDNQIIIN